MILTYIFHSAFAIECKTCTLIIDFWRDAETETYKEGFVQHYLLKKEKPIYVLSSHFHGDHFNPEILKWKNKNPNITYIFGKDILIEQLADLNDANYLDKGDSYKDNLITIKAFGSTDSGISFLINIENKTLFHAGDLNNWHWSDEASPEESKEAENNYLKELAILQKEVSVIDLAMFPVDNRMGSDYDRGAKQFIEAIDVKKFAPMHFGRQYDAANTFEKVAKQHGTEFLKITHIGQQFEI